MSVTFRSPADALALVGQPLGETEWLTVTQAMVDRFAEVTGDRQWIHIDPERSRHGPLAHAWRTAT